MVYALFANSQFLRKQKELKITKPVIGLEEFQIRKHFDESYNWLNNSKNQSFSHALSFICFSKNSENKNEDLDNKVLGFKFDTEKRGMQGLNLLKETFNLFTKKKYRGNIN